MTVAGTELALHVEAAFAAGPATRDRILAYAINGHARPAIIAALQSPPDRPCPTIHDVWHEFGHLPVSG